MRVLHDVEAPVGAGFDNGIADVGQVGDPVPVVETVPAAALRSAFDDMPGDRARGDLIPRVGCPAERMHQRPQRQPGIGHASRDHDLGAALQRFDDRSRAEIGVGGEDFIADVMQGAARVEVHEIVPAGDQAVEASQQIVSGDDADRQFAVQPELPRDGGYRHGAGAGIHAARIGSDLDPPLHDRGEDPLHLCDEVRGIAARGIARFLFL